LIEQNWHARPRALPGKMRQRPPQTAATLKRQSAPFTLPAV
jgi:hypothetical protein